MSEQTSTPEGATAEGRELVPRIERKSHRTVTMPTRTLGRGAVGGMWHHTEEGVTLLLFPDHGDDCRALVTITADAADELAEHLHDLAKWTRRYSNGMASGAGAGLSHD